MGQREEKIVVAFLDAEVEGDIEKALTYWADDAEYRVHAWKKPIKGLEAIRAVVERQLAESSGASYEVLNIASTDQLVFVERIDRFPLPGVEGNGHVHIVGAFTIDSHGKISSQREYADSREVEAQMKTKTD